MPGFEGFARSQTIKVLYMGHSGSGKTGSTVALAAAGYNVRILDLDKGVEIIEGFVNDKERSPYRRPKLGLWTQEQADTLSKRISYVAIDESMKNIRGRFTPAGDAWTKITDQLTEWKDGEANYGNVDTWGAQDVLVIDGLTRLSDAAWHWQLKLNGRLPPTRPEQSDYGATQSLIRELLRLLYSTEIKCHVVMICHIDFMETDAGPTRGFPKNKGKALAPEIGTFFNHAIMAQSTGSGEGAKRVIKTNTAGMVELKTAAPLRVKPEYDLSTGLAEYWRDVLGGSANGK